MPKTKILLDNNVKHLKKQFRAGAITIEEAGVGADASDEEVISVADKLDRILVTSDLGIKKKYKQYQKETNSCGSGLVILPADIESQQRFFDELRRKRITFRHVKYKRPITWEIIRKNNLVVHATGNKLLVEKLCECELEHELDKPAN